MTFSKHLLHFIFIFLFFFPHLNSSEPKNSYISSGGGRNIVVPLASSSFISKESLISSLANGLYNFILLVLKLIYLSLIGLFIAITSYVAYIMFSSDRVPTEIRRSIARLASRKLRGCDAESLILELYKKVELKENMKLPGKIDVICPICLSEYARNETVGCLLGCEHCFHIECINTWLKLHCSCPICRNEVSPQRKLL